MCHFELPLGVILNRRELWGRFGWLKNTCQWFFNHIKKYNKWWLSNTKQRILFLWHYFKSTLQHYVKDFKISSHWLWLPLNFKIALFLVQSPVARGFELHGHCQFFVNADVGKILLVMITSEKKLSLNRFAVWSDLTYWQTPPKKSPYQKKAYFYISDFQKFWPNVPSFCWMILGKVTCLVCPIPTINSLLILFVKNKKKRFFFF